MTGGCASVAWLVVSEFSIDEFNELMLPILGTLFAHGWESSRLSLFQSVGAHRLGPSSINTKTNTLHGREEENKTRETVVKVRESASRLVDGGQLLRSSRVARYCAGTIRGEKQSRQEEKEREKRTNAGYQPRKPEMQPIDARECRRFPPSLSPQGSKLLRMRRRLARIVRIQVLRHGRVPVGQEDRKKPPRQEWQRQPNPGVQYRNRTVGQEK